jgi:hypothetical protein
MGPADVSLQHQRCRAELDLLNQYFPGLTRSPNRNGTPFYPAYVDIPMTTRARNRYIVRLVIPAAYPDRMPTMLVVNPRPLLDYHGRPLLRTNASMHVLGSSDGCTCLCHYNSELWDSNLALQMVALKGGLWLEAYEGHRRTGRPIDHWLSHTDPSHGPAVAPPVQPRAAVATPSPPQSFLYRLAARLRRLFNG